MLIKMFSQREFGLWFKVHFGNLANEQKLNKKGNVGGVLFTARKKILGGCRSQLGFCGISVLIPVQHGTIRRRK